MRITANHVAARKDRMRTELRVKRESARLTQLDLALKAGVSRSLVYLAEKGAPISTRKAAAIASALQLDAWFIWPDMKPAGCA